MTYASTSIDRRAAYYSRCAALIAADPLDFYTRAEKGRRFLASRLNPYVVETPKFLVEQYLSDVSRKYSPEATQGRPYALPRGR
jgi:hypothetical protein